MIALPGLTLAVGRQDEAAAVLRTFAQYVDQGMLPNRFPDEGRAPEYNTVDATLWYFQAVYALPGTPDWITRQSASCTRSWSTFWTGTVRARASTSAATSDGLLYAGELGSTTGWTPRSMNGS